MVLTGYSCITAFHFFLIEILYEHNLLAVSHSSPAGIQVSLTSSHGGELFHEQFSNLSLPLECGENFSRCESLLVVSNKLDKNVTQFVSAIPVTRAVLLLDIRDNGSALLLHSSFVLSQNIEDCNPTAIFKIAKSIYTMCFNERTAFLTVIELRIRDPGSIHKAFFVRPTLLGGRFFDIADQVSNFLSINSTDERYVVFASGNTLTVYAPINTATFPTDIPIQCSPQRIEHASGVVVAYCSDRSLSIDIISQKTNITFYNESGYPFICPNYPLIKLSAFYSNETYLQYQDLQGDRNVTKEILISGNGSSFHDSKCFGTGTTFFVYSDNGGSHVVNITSGRDTNLLPHGYPNPSCLNVLGGRYLIIQGEQNGTEAEIYIFDSSQNLTEVVRTQSQKADLMAVILTSRSIEPSLSPTPTITVDISTLLASTPQTMPVVPTVTPTAPLATAVSVSVVAVVVVVAAVVVAVVVMVVVGAVIFLGR